jgi:hypothetical protein
MRVPQSRCWLVPLLHFVAAHTPARFTFADTLFAAVRGGSRSGSACRHSANDGIPRMNCNYVCLSWPNSGCGGQPPGRDEPRACRWWPTDEVAPSAPFSQRSGQTEGRRENHPRWRARWRPRTRTAPRGSVLHQVRSRREHPTRTRQRTTAPQSVAEPCQCCLRSLYHLDSFRCYPARVGHPLYAIAGTLDTTLAVIFQSDYVDRLTQARHRLASRHRRRGQRVGGRGPTGDGYVSTTRGQSLRIAPIAADLRFGSVRVKGRACSIACDAGGALDACRAGPHFP